jgi:hypothetical protein
METRRYQWSFAELIDRLSIVIQKIIYSETEEMRDLFAQERNDIIHDLDLFIAEGVEVDGKMLSDAMSLQIVNCAIWNGESAGRGDGGEKNYALTHALNSNRAEVKKNISERANGRVDHKLNYGLGAWDLKL